MTDFRIFFKQSSQYLIGQSLIIVAGFISFPILTRVLSVSEYGIVSLVTSTIFIMLAVSKLGMNHSAIRYYEEFRGERRKESISHFYSTQLIGSVVSTTAIIAVFWVVLQMIPEDLFDERFRELFLLVCILVFLRSIHQILRVFVRAEQRTIMWNAVVVAQKYATLILGLGCYFCVLSNLRGYYLGQTIAEIIILVYLLYELLRRADIHWKFFSANFLRQSIRYGIPMLAAEGLGALTNYTDRYLIEYFHGAYSLGVYSVGSNMVGYVGLVLSVPMQLGLMPVCMSIWERKGAQATREFLGEALRYFFLIAFPVVVGFISIGREVTILVASDKYASSCVVIPYLMVANALLAGTNIFAVPVLVKKKSEELAFMYLLVFVECVLVSLAVIPMFGVVGAAYVKVIVYLTLFVLAAVWSVKHLRIRCDYRSALLCLMGSLLMYVVIRSLEQVGSGVLYMLIKMGLGAIFYVVFLVLFDKKIRGYVRSMVRTVRTKMVVWVRS